ncbi:MAG: hypothetical protein ACP5N7_03235 [Candidatus Pacearchaeota archaeon]
MCLGCGFSDHEGNVQYARNSGNSPEMMVVPREYVSRTYSRDIAY